jgi:hypothetical protein
MQGAPYIAHSALDGGEGGSHGSCMWGRSAGRRRQCQDG